MEQSISATITRVTMKDRSMCCSVFIWQKMPLGSANMVAKKIGRKKKREKRQWKDDRTLIRSNHMYINLIFCGLEWTKENGTH
jgi:hypothetical protein